MTTEPDRDVSQRDLPWVTVVMPVRGEGDGLRQSLGSVLAQDYPVDRLEIVVANGDVADGGPDVALEMARGARFPVRVLDNPEGLAATGMNHGIRAARGQVIVRVDGHAEVPPDFVSASVDALHASGADCVGGAIRTVGEGAFGRAVAAAMSCRFGVGGSGFRTAPDHEGDVDTVPFGAYRREVFDRVGLFDAGFVRNQDDELHLRLIRAGGRIFQSPSVRSSYRCRSSLRELAGQFFGYGFWKVAVLRRHGTLPSTRGLAPPAFVIGLLASIGAAAITGQPLWALAVAAPYAVASGMAAAVASGGDVSALRVAAAFATMHLSYGVGFLAGLVACRPRRTDTQTVRRAFEERDADGGYRARHGDDDVAHRLAVEERRRVAADLLGTRPVTAVLDVGCGAGDSLASLPAPACGARLHGIDLVPERLRRTRTRLPGVSVAAADARRLPYADDVFDLCILHTVLSSTPEPGARATVAAEALRVLGPGGRVLLYDYSHAPPGRGTRGVRPREWKALFPGCSVVSRSLTPAPPLARIVAKCLPRALSALESVPALRTHRLVVVEKP